MKTTSLAQLEQNDDFISRHIGPTDADVATMLECLDADFLEELISKAVPQNILTNRALEIGEAHSEGATLDIIYKMACMNKVFKSFIGMGYYGCITPGVILRNILEDPAWYTAYTPYQAEISQGRMAALLNFQTMIRDLTGLEIANASMLDEGTAAAEAMIMCHSLQKKVKKGINTFWVADDCHPQTIEVLQTRAQPLGIQLEIGNLDAGFPQSEFFGMLVQYPGSTGNVRDFKAIVEQAHAVNALVVAASDLLALTLLTPPGEMGADVVVGSAQRFGVPMGFGGPHAAFFATRDDYKRTVPGRIIGVSVDRNGKPALRLALQTREQHIRREKATSNICTSQVLLAVIASMYAVYHGPERLKIIAQRVHRLAAILAAGLERLGHRLSHQHFFDTITLEPVGIDVAAIRSRAEACSINLRFLPDGRVGIALDETSTKEDLDLIWTALAPATVDFTLADLEDSADRIPAELLRTSSFMDHEVFNSYHSETEMLRYINELASRDLTLAHSMIPLGSCTMKLNATTEMLPITWKKFSAIHPFAPKDQVQGYTQLINELEGMLSDITGFPGISLQPNAGSQGEYAGLLTIRHYHASRGESHRNICIIPSSAHGTNPASAVMAGMQVVVVGCDHQGNIDVADLEARAIAHKDNLAGLMITYPSTHGVFEEAITRICEIIHQNGGQVYMDGANMNALVGLCRPGEFGPDVIHLNLHKTFCIPHGGGGPGIGPIGVAEHLKPFLPGHHQRPDSFPETAPTAVSAAPWGSASILPISWAYIRLMGSSGLTRATQVAILNANYIAKRLEKSYPILYKGINGMVAHECIIDLRPLKQTSGVEVEDVAKRLMDYGFHAPTMSWPVAGTLMIEPTESESLAELDRFCEALISIREEIRAIEEGKMDRLDNPLKNAPHVIDDLLGEWGHPYSRTQAVYPLPWLKEHKFWPTVSRIDNAYGDKNLVCSCLPVDSYK